MALEMQWTETSYAAQLPNFGDEIPQALETNEVVDDVETMASGGEYLCTEIKSIR